MKYAKAIIIIYVSWILGFLILDQILEAYEVEETMRLQSYYRSLQNPESNLNNFESKK